ncbi:MAG TPA: hypothetical protein VE861_12675 [Gemmatimonadaceae bacterium]|nr:hypothetical protein [Gemmatimonadaceae bacterium]
MNSIARAAVAGALAVASVDSVAAQAPAAPDRIQFVKVVARDYVFDAPASVQSGIATIQLVNQGADIHHVTVQELPQGKTVKDFFDATRNSGRAPAWSKTLGQTATIANGAEAFISFRMPPGRYILSCLIPAQDGRSHVAKGMYQVITASAAPVMARQGVTRPAAARRP